MPAALADKFATAEANRDRNAAWLTPEVSERFASMLMLFPVEDGSQAVERIVAQLLEATDLDGLNAPWRSENTGAMADRTVVITGAKILPSQYQEGLGAFLYVEAIDGKTGEDASWTTSSTSIMAQLANAASRDALPIRAKVVKADRPSSRGYYPFHLEVASEKASAERVKVKAERA